jgi:hypothetical protein
MCKKQFQETILIPDQHAEILAAVDAAQASIARGEGRTITQVSMRQLAGEVKQRGRIRLVRERAVPR